MDPDILVEVCLDSAESAIAAQAGGADRVELCDDLIEGGTTPSSGMIATTRSRIDIGLMVMIRPRGGDFCYSEIEREAMLHDVERALELGADGVVFGLLRPDATVDEEATRPLIEAARPMGVTFHRAFDMTRDPFEALEALIRMGVDRVLTSGQEPSVLEGLDLIAELVERAGDRIVVMPGCGITSRNVERIVAASRAKEIHIVGVESRPSPMEHRNARCFMGTELRSPEYLRTVTSAREVGGIISRIRE